jgi:hypothetical protein
MVKSIALDAPNRLIFSYPLALVPLYAVPVLLILHGLVRLIFNRKIPVGPIAAVFALPNLRSFRDDHCPLTGRKLMPMEISRQHELGEADFVLLVYWRADRPLVRQQSSNIDAIRGSRSFIQPRAGGSFSA